jgi:hypothetical protein
VELLLTDVTVCTVNAAATTIEPEIELTATGVTLYLEGRKSGNTSRIVAGRFFYRVLDDRYLGPMLRWIRPLEVPE